MKKIIIANLFFILFLLNSHTALSGELHIWVDENGEKHITENEPEKTGKVIGKESYKPTSPYEIEQFQAEQKRREQISEARHKRNQSIEETKKQNEQYNRKLEEKAKQQEISRKKSQSVQGEYLETEKRILNAIENKDYREARRLRLVNEKRIIDNEKNNLDE